MVASPAVELCVVEGDLGADELRSTEEQGTAGEWSEVEGTLPSTTVPATLRTGLLTLCKGQPRTVPAQIPNDQHNHHAVAVSHHTASVTAS
jgi:hypothetical protein